MGSKKDLSGGIGLLDVAFNVTGFEVMNQVRIVITLIVADARGRAEIEVTSAAYRRDDDPAVDAPLASVSATCSAMNVQSLEAAVIHSLYLLDGKLAREELRGGN